MTAPGGRRKWEPRSARFPKAGIRWYACGIGGGREVMSGPFDSMAEAEDECRKLEGLERGEWRDAGDHL